MSDDSSPNFYTGFSDANSKAEESISDVAKKFHGDMYDPWKISGAAFDNGGELEPFQCWVLLDGATFVGAKDFTLSEMESELESRGIKVFRIPICPGGQEICPKELGKVLNQLMPKYIVWNGAAAWRFYDVIKATQAKRISLWFDDPIMPGEAFNVEKTISSSLLVNFFCWDEYWAGEMVKKWNFIPPTVDQIHLAASPRDYYTSEVHLTDDIVFIGHLHSQYELDKTRDCMPSIFNKAARDATAYIIGKNHIPSADVVLGEVLKSWSAGSARLFNDLIIRNQAHIRNLKWYIWAISKNMVRTRMLSSAIEVAPVRMFSETKQLNHASVPEIQQMVGDCSGKKLMVFDSTTYNSKDLCQLYHYGRLHIQATDPQSVVTGIPYRVFQTAAAGRALLTDYKPGWEKVFEPEKEILFYEPETFQSRLSGAYQEKEKLEEIGRAARTRFENEHTWAHRIDQIIRQAA